MIWELAHRADPRCCAIADRHYNRQKVGSPQFMPPGSCVVFYAEGETGAAVWGTSAPLAEYVKHAWAGAWVCSIFRNEGAGIASELIGDALAATRAFYGEPPALGLVTFINRKMVRPTKVRGADVWGWTYLRAGFRVIGETAGGLLALGIAPGDMPPPRRALGPIALFDDPCYPTGRERPLGGFPLGPGDVPPAWTPSERGAAR